MASLGTIEFTGKSGTSYTFHIYAWGTPFREGVGGVYFVTRAYRNSSGAERHDPIYVGETGDLSTRFDDHHKQECFDRHNTNHLCIYFEEDQTQRVWIENDLKDAYYPPCNE